MTIFVGALNVHIKFNNLQWELNYIQPILCVCVCWLVQINTRETIERGPSSGYEEVQQYSDYL